MLTLQRDNKAIISKLDHEVSIAKIERLQSGVENETDLQRLLVAAEQRKQVCKIQAESIRLTAELKANAFKNKKIKEAEAYKLEKEE